MKAGLFLFLPVSYISFWISQKHKKKLALDWMRYLKSINDH